MHARMVSYNANNYHWVEEDVSSFCTDRLTSILSGQGYTVSDLSVSMQLTVRMNRMGFMHDISCRLERDGMRTIVKDFDNYSGESDIDGDGQAFIDALERVKDEIREKNRALLDSKVSSTASIAFDRNSGCSADRTTESVTDTLVVTFRITCGREAFLNYIFEPSYYTAYAPGSPADAVRINDSICFTNLDRKGMALNVRMPDTRPPSRVELEIRENADSLDVRLSQTGVVKGCEDRVRSFWMEHLFPKISVLLSCAIIG